MERKSCSKGAFVSDDVNLIKWTRPLSLKQWCVIFGVHRSTMAAWFKKQVICNEQLSPRRWRVCYGELPAEIVLPLSGGGG